jgi:hypothetical protein
LRRAKRREEMAKANGNVLIVVTPPTPPKVGEDEWDLTPDMKEFWRERAESKRVRDDVSFLFWMSLFF